MHDSDLTNKENVLLLKEVNKKISTINDEESRQRDILITNIRMLIDQHSNSGTLFLGGASIFMPISDLLACIIGKRWFDSYGTLEAKNFILQKMGA